MLIIVLDFTRKSEFTNPRKGLYLLAFLLHPLREVNNFGFFQPNPNKQGLFYALAKGFRA